MAHVLIMPRQGNTVESCIIGDWMVKEGDTVEIDSPVCSVETDKAAFEVPAGAAGTVLKILYSSGDDVPVLQPIMVIGKPGENWEDLLPKGNDIVQTESPPKDPIEKSEILITQTDLLTVYSKNISISPRASRLADKEAVDIAKMLKGSGPGGRIIEQDINAFLEKRPPLSQAAKDELRKRIAQGLPANTEMDGSGIGGRITLNDLNAVSINQEDSQNKSSANEFFDTPIKGIRKIIADQMMKSHLNTAAFTLNSSAQVLKLQELRSRFKTAAPELGLNKITINDLILYGVSRILPLHPNMNAHKLDGIIRTFKKVHLGVAVSTDRGLMVPVIRNAHLLSLVQISERAKELAALCRTGAISPDDLKGSTFTISNLGNTGIESFNPVINIPEVAILGVCSISPKPVETSTGHYEFIPHIGLSLTVDHAVVDGAPAAEFLKELCALIRDIDLWLIK